MKLKRLDPKVQEAVSINESDLQSEFVQFSGQLAYWLCNRADAQSRVLACKAELGLREAVARERILVDEPKLRIDDLRARLDLDPSVQAAQKLLADATHAADYIGAVCEALRRKGDMLVSLGAHQRALLPRGPDLG